jgi:murein DD-endopeptidase MepM/ murein hydrolase activator NlpD
LITRVFLVCTLLLLLSGPARAEIALELTGKATEGGLLIGKTDPGASVTLDGKAVRTSEDGHFLLGFGRDETGSKQLQIALMGQVIRRDIAIAERAFKTERVDGLPERKVTPDPKALERIRQESAEMAAVKASSTAKPLFLSGFLWPARGRISGIYGSQRILNGKPRRPHYGTDVAAPVGTPVHAIADGKVVYVHDGMFFNGKTVLIDHGLGLRSVYIHLSETLILQGSMVRAGERIGAVGQTGRATGPHLHFALTLDETPIDAELLLGPMPE